MKKSSLSHCLKPGTCFVAMRQLASKLAPAICVLTLGIGSMFSAGSSLAASSDDPNPRWATLKSQLFDERDVIVNAGIIQLDAPARAFDAARVPVTLRTLKPQTESSYINKLYLIVDQNPVPAQQLRAIR